jgi:hypothetical protein
LGERVSGSVRGLLSGISGCGVDNDLAIGADADALGSDTGDGLQREMDNAALARIHGIELERLPRSLDTFGGGAGHHLQFFNAKGAVASAVEKNFVLPRRLEAKSAMGKMFDGLKEFCASFQQKIFVAAGEFGKDFRVTIVCNGALRESANARL